ncbi:hypothetical protein ISP17_11445 [Dyella ginsengisoli]|uniref:Uncharacterized protein n=1 Tax=Dyella ginsengisoli TaxID=363848 RepID=A0ABW8JWR6_9GAMM
MIVRLEHLAGVPGFSVRGGFCRRGARAWFARHQLDWNAFRHHGIDSAEIERIDDPFARATLAHVKQLEATDGRQ